MLDFRLLRNVTLLGMVALVVAPVASSLASNPDPMLALAGGGGDVGDGDPFALENADKERGVSAGVFPTNGRAPYHFVIYHPEYDIVWEFWEGMTGSIDDGVITYEVFGWDDGLQFEIVIVDHLDDGGNRDEWSFEIKDRGGEVLESGGGTVYYGP